MRLTLLPTFDVRAATVDFANQQLAPQKLTAFAAALYHRNLF